MEYFPDASLVKLKNMFFDGSIGFDSQEFSAKRTVRDN